MDANLNNLAYLISDNKTEQIIESEHSQPISFVCFNELKDQFVTCGQDGQIHYYQCDNKSRVDQQIKPPTKIGYIAVFDDPIIYADWGKGFNRPYLTVGTSQGSIAILKMHLKTGVISVEETINFKKNNIMGIVDIKWAENSPQFMVGTSSGNLYLIRFNPKVGKWQQEMSHSFKQQFPVYVAYNPANQDQLIIGIQEDLIIGKLGIDKNNKHILRIQRQIKSDKIKRILFSSQFPSSLNFMAVLTKNLIIFYQTDKKGEINDKNLMKKQIGMVDYITWGNDQTEIVCYSKSHQEKPEKEGNSLKELRQKPQKLVMNLCGEWELEDETCNKPKNS